MPHWENGAIAQRWVGLPGTASVALNGRSGSFPENAVLVKTIFWPDEGNVTKQPPGIPLETQLLHYDGQHWNAYTYAWNADRSDAYLVKDVGEVVRKDDEGSALSGLPGEYVPYAWQYESRASCLRCHNSWSGYALGWNRLQLKGTSRASETLHASWDLLDQMNLVSDSSSRRPRRSETMDDLEYEARSYLHANCGHCHRENGGAMIQSICILKSQLKRLH